VLIHRIDDPALRDDVPRKRIADEEPLTLRIGLDGSSLMRISFVQVSPPSAL
jgi:hypothetical protein